MSKFMGKVYKNYVWIIIGLSLIAYFASRVLSFDGSIESAAKDVTVWLQLLFVAWLNVNMVSGAYDSGTNNGLNSEEFELADKLNNDIISSVNNEMKDFRNYVKSLNQHELISIQEDYLFKIGDKKVEELSEKELKEYKKLKPVRHNIYGFNLPLFYEISKNGEVSYKASLLKNQGKRKKQIKKIFTGLLFGSLTVNMIFNVENVGDAFVSLLIISSGLIMTFIMTYFPQVAKFKFDIPKKVIRKKILYESYIDFKNGKHILKKVGNYDEKKVNDNNDTNIVLNNDELSKNKTTN